MVHLKTNAIFTTMVLVRTVLLLLIFIEILNSYPVFAFSGNRFKFIYDDDDFNGSGDDAVSTNTDQAPKLTDFGRMYNVNYEVQNRKASGEVKTGQSVIGEITRTRIKPVARNKLKANVNLPLPPSSDGFTSTKQSKRHRHRLSKGNKPSNHVQAPDTRHVHFATENSHLLTILKDEDTGQSVGKVHRKIIVYNLVPDMLRDLIAKDAQDGSTQSSLTGPGDILGGSPRKKYYDRLANNVNLDGQHGAFVFDRDAEKEYDWTGVRDSKENKHHSNKEKKESGPFDSKGKTGSTLKVSKAFDESMDESHDTRNIHGSEWPSFRSLLTPGRVDESALYSEEETDEVVDQDYQSDSYHRFTPGIDGKFKN